MNKIIYTLVMIVFMIPAGAIAKQGICQEGNCENGHGTFEYATGMKYTGYWFEGLEHGKGKMTMEIGTTYEGDYRKGKPHGVGEFILPDDIKYLARPVLAHRLILSEEERLRGEDSDHFIDELIGQISVPAAAG